MVEDLIKRLRERATVASVLGEHANAALFADSAVLIEQQAARIAESESHRNDLADKIVEQRTEIGALKTRLTALESERDALLAAAGKEAVGQAGAMPGTDGFAMACFKASDVPIGTPLYTAPTAALENGDGRDAWISVDERMPDEDSVVLVSAWEYGKPDGKRFTLVARRSGSLFLNEETGDDLYTPTHWQPLPAPPAALSQKAGEQQ
jgi:hypothetical protein